MHQRQRVAQGLADAFLCGGPEPSELIERGSTALGASVPWLEALAVRIQLAFGHQWPWGAADLGRFILADPAFEQSWSQPGAKPRIRRWFLPASTMGQPVPPLAACALPSLPSPGELADWLGLSCRELDWLADPWGSERRAPAGPLRHYVYHSRTPDLALNSMRLDRVINEAQVGTGIFHLLGIHAFAKCDERLLGSVIG